MPIECFYRLNRPFAEHGHVTLSIMVAKIGKTSLFHANFLNF